MSHNKYFSTFLFLTIETLSQDQPAATGPVPNLTMSTSSGQIVNRSQPATRKNSTSSVIPNQPNVETSKHIKDAKKSIS